MITSENVVKYEESSGLENVITDIQNGTAQEVSRDGLNHKSKFNVKIVRNLYDDSFKVFIEDIVNTSPATFHFVQINGVKSASSENSMHASKRVNIGGKNYFRINSKLMGDIKFKDLKKLIVGYQRYSTVQAAYQINFAPSQKKQKSMNVSFGQIAEFKVLKEVNISLKVNLHSKANYYESNKYKEVNYDLKYSRAFYKPSHKDRYSPVQELGSIYRNDDEGITPINFNQDEFVKTAPKLTTTSLTKSTLNDVAYKIKSNQPSLNVETDNGEIVVNYSKTMFFNGRTSYDYEKQKTILGGTESPVLGEIIPYSFSGQYQWLQKITPFEILKDFTIHTYKNYNHAVLNESDGDIIMKINIDEDNGVTPSYVLGDIEIKKIKEYKLLYDLRLLRLMGTVDA